MFDSESASAGETRIALFLRDLIDAGLPFEEIVEKTGYDSERDLDNPTGSVFCAHGAGFVVPWNQVEEYMHLESGVDAEELAAGESWYEELENEADRCGAENHQEGNDSGNSGRKKKKVPPVTPTAAATRMSRNCRQSLREPSAR